MKSWQQQQFHPEAPELAATGDKLLFRSRIGLSFLAPLRKDGAPRLHLASLILSSGHLYIIIPPTPP